MVEGQVAGELKLFNRAPEFSLSWKLVLGKSEAGEQTFAYVIDLPSTRLIATGRVNLATGDGVWRIEEGRVDAAVWLGLLAPQLGPVLAGATAKGIFSVSGEGTLCQGQATGKVKIAWREGALIHAEQGWSLDGISFQGEFAIDVANSSLVSASPFELKVGTITTTRFGARNMFVKALLNEQRALAVSLAQVEVAGGEVTVDPFGLPLNPLVVDANLRIKRVGLQDIVLLVPTAGLSDARGRIDGVVRVKWTEGLGFQLGVGNLAIANDEPAIVRMTPSPGLLTGRLPEHFDLLPSWLGPLARWARQVNPAYGNMKDIELGDADLRVKTLDVQLTPEGDERGRSAVVRLVAQPAKEGSAVKEVAFDVNVAGPLNAVLKLGIDRGFTLGVD